MNIVVVNSLICILYLKTESILKLHSQVELPPKINVFVIIKKLSLQEKNTSNQRRWYLFSPISRNALLKPYEELADSIEVGVDP